LFLLLLLPLSLSARRAKNISKKTDKSTASKTDHPKHHNSPSKHHKLTTNYHQETQENPQTPEKIPSSHLKLFSQTNAQKLVQT
jgi:hypothetical protein